MKIGIISDTHGFFDDDLMRFLAPVDQIWHAGDIGSIDIADAINDYRPLTAVHGNIDGGTTRVVYPRYQIFECEGVRVAMTHIGGYPNHYEQGVAEVLKEHKPNLFISGHSHILRVMYDKKNDLLHINPGAAGRSGFHRVRTAIRLDINQGDMTNLEVVEWSRD